MMSLRLISYFGGALLALVSPKVVMSAEIVQGFMNPSFGGNPNYYGNLMGHANTINNYKDPSLKSSTSQSGNGSATNPDGTESADPTTGEMFQKRLESLILTALATRLVNQAFGLEDGAKLPGEINTGFNTIGIEDLDGFTRLTITDNATGGQTVIDIPKF